MGKIEDELEKFSSKTEKVSLRFSANVLKKIDARVKKLSTDRTKYITALILQDVEKEK